MKKLLSLIRTSLFICILFVLSIFVVQAQGWEREFPVENYIHSTLLPDDEVMILSHSSLFSKTYILTRVDASGRILSQFEVESTNSSFVEIHYDAINGGLLLVGLQFHIFNVHLRKINMDGSVVEWDQLYNNDGPLVFGVFDKVTVEPGSDGSWLIMDATQDKIGDDWLHPHFLNVLRVDAQGNPIWQQRYHSDESDSLHLIGVTIKEQSNGNYIIAGIGQRGSDNFYPFLKHLAADGTETAIYWGEAFERIDLTNNNIPFHATQTADGNFIFMKSNMLINDHQTPIIKVNPTAEIIWEKGVITFLGFGQANPTQLLALEDGGFVIPLKYILCDDVGADPECWSNYNIIKYNELGEEVWNTFSDGITFNTYQFDDLHAFELSDNGIITVGRGSSSDLQVEDQTLYTYLIRLNQDGAKLGNQLTGTVFIDQNQNCVFDEGEYTLPQQIISLSSIDTPSYRTITIPTGEYSIRVAPGSYTIELENLSELFGLDCYPTPEDLQVIFTEDYATQTFDIALTPLVECPSLSVQVGVGEITPCESSNYRINYCNTGTDLAQNAFVTLQLDPHQRITNSAISPTPIGGNQFQFNVGNVEPGRCFFFDVQIELSCEVEVGRSHCVKAQIYPYDPCVPPSATWDESHIEVSANCDNGEEVIFTIQNTGTGNMVQQRPYYVYEDHVMYEMEEFRLDAGEILEVTRAANGTTMRLEAAQSEGNPSHSTPIVFVEACGVNEDGSISTGVVNSVTDGDFDDFLDIVCVISTASFDPNDKAVSPSGVTPEHHFVNVTDQLNYKIRFQNTGTDTAELVIIRDTLSQHLDISTFTSGVSSHNYKVHFIDTNVIEFHFDPIELPDSNVNEPASHGFVEFSIYPYPSTELRTRIENTAAIYFDNNAPVITNTTFNTIGERFYTIGIISSTDEVLLEGLHVEITPNPIRGQAVMSLNGIDDLQDVSLVIYDMYGRSIHQYQNQGSSKMVIEARDLLPGMYFYRLQKGDQEINAGKLLIE